MSTNRLFLIVCFLFMGIACKQNYLPPEQKTNPAILVIEGVIDAKPGDSTVFQLSRTQAVSDSVGVHTPETGAKLTIIGSAGDTWPFHELGNGSYSTAPLSLNPTEKYQLRVVTKNGSQYLSDTVSVHPSPAIDSLTWYQDDSAGDVHVRINTHDPSNNSHYYRWYFSELWEYHSDEYAELTLVNGQIEYADTSTSTWTCWRGANSSDILLGNSTTLSQDRINQAPLAIIPRGSQKLSVRYSMLATQYVLSQPAYQYWQTLQKNTQNLGSLFDPQPSQLNGNYHNTTNPKEAVIGFLSASSLQNLRFFINNNQVHNWDTAHQSCDTKFASAQDPNNFHIYLDTDTLYGPFYFLQGALVLGKKTCIDCRVQGGTTTRPSFW
ncbi:MAG: DUF4249 domain-containing protein [Bacteroidetes bacterium]|nr:DUF4249 domain-containing protein [Bacteroidota bacterium]